MNEHTPNFSSGWRMPAEWETQSAVLLSYPLNPLTWPGCRKEMEEAYAAFAAAVTKYEDLKVNCLPVSAQERALELFRNAGADCSRIEFLPVETNDAWCRDHGPVFVRNLRTGERAALDFQYNAWGGKFPPWDLDNAAARKMSEILGIPCLPVPLVLEGGALEVNGAGALLSTESVVLNPNRNPGLTKERAEEIFRDVLGTECVLWLKSGLEGDDTDGHIDTLVRFFRKDAVLAAVDEKPSSINHDALKRNFDALKRMRLPDGSPLEVLALPSPDPIRPEGWREEVLPATYANFLIINGAVLVPTYRQDKNDAKALEIIGSAFPGRDIVPLDCVDILLEGGALHCLSQQMIP